MPVFLPSFAMIQKAEIKILHINPPPTPSPCDCFLNQYDNRWYNWTQKEDTEFSYQEP